MLKRKVSAPKSAPRSKTSSPKVPKAKAAPVRRRFVISSKAVKPEASKPAPAPSPAVTKLVAAKAPANGQPQEASATPTLTTSVDLTETIKTLLHLSQEHGYVTYDDIN